MTLEQLGYKLTLKQMDGEYPSEVWKKAAEHGWWVQSLIFDTIHGGPWTFESCINTFYLNEELNWTTQERIDFNPASRDFIGSNIGHWCLERSVLDADECMAIAEHIRSLEKLRLQLKVVSS